MRNAMLVPLLAILSGHAGAEWISVGSNAEKTAYADLKSRRTEGGVVNMWTLLDYKTTQKTSTTSFLSEKVRVDFDCAEGKVRKGFYSNYAENMAMGRPLDTSISPSDWMTVLCDDADEALWQAACEGNIPSPSETKLPEALTTSVAKETSAQQP